MSKDLWSEDVWRVVHIFSRSSSIAEPEEKDAFRTFMYTLHRLCSATSMKDSIGMFFDQPDNDIQSYMSSNDRLFSWTVYFRQHVAKLQGNTPVPTLAELTAFYHPKHISKTVWGNAAWKLIHALPLKTAREADGTWSKSTSVTFKAFLTTVAILIPCLSCRKHCWMYLSTQAIDPLLSHPDEVFEWTVAFHNGVNIRLNAEGAVQRKIMSVYDAKLLYQ